MCHGLIPISCQPRRDGCTSPSPFPTPHSILPTPHSAFPLLAAPGAGAPGGGDQSCSLRGTTAPAAGRASPRPLAPTGGPSTDGEHAGRQQRSPVPGRKGRSGDVDVGGDGGHDRDGGGEAFLPRCPPRYRTRLAGGSHNKTARDACAGLRRPESCPAAAAQPWDPGKAGVQRALPGAGCGTR